MENSVGFEGKREDDELNDGEEGDWKIGGDVGGWEKNINYCVY